jgi:hypothetical protein
MDFTTNKGVVRNGKALIQRKIYFGNAGVICPPRSEQGSLETIACQRATCAGMRG